MNIKKLLHLPISLLLLGCTSDNALEENISCDEIKPYLSQLSEETAIAFNGAESEEFIKSIINNCKNEKIASVESCNSIANDAEKKVCLFGVGAKIKTIDECENNSDCLQIFASTHFKDCSIFKNKKDTAALENICLYSQAINSLDIKYCNEIKIEKISSEECKNLNEDNFNKCYFNKYKCLWVISDLKNELSICETMEKSFEKDVCLLSNAIENRDVKVCKQLELIFTEKYCKELIEQGKNHPNIKNSGILNNKFK